MCSVINYHYRFHVTTKSIPYYDAILGRTKKPIRPNGRKLERYIYDIFRHIYTTTSMDDKEEIIKRCSRNGEVA